VDDCVRGIIKAIDAPFHFEIINLASQQRTSVNELVDVLGEVMRIEPRRVSVPPPRGLAPDFYADISKAQTLLRFRPKTGLAEGIALFLSWYRRSYSCCHAQQGHADAEEGIM
jgi:UDP-glucuronate 4-epimerase